MIYLDNSATTFHKPKCVKDAVKESLKKYIANPGRSGHSFSISTGLKVLEARELIASIVNCDTERVIFTGGCTEALNLAIIGCAKPKGHIITTCFEHNSVLRTLAYLQKTMDITFTVLFPDNNLNNITIEKFEKAVQPNTYMTIVNHISNVVGIEQNIEEIGNFCYSNNLLFVVDGAQSMGHRIIDMKKCHINLLAMAGHKGLYSLQGVGCLCVSEDTPLSPIKFGGTGTNSEDLTQPNIFPEGFESGTLPTPAIISLHSGTKYAYEHLEAINSKINKLSKILLKSLTKNKNVTLYTPITNYNGVISFLSVSIRHK